jgi:hypothetical protein
MKVIVIRQPWAWLIVNGFKDVENRSWATRYRGPLLIQASEYREYARGRGVKLPEQIDLGGIIGMARIDDCVKESRSQWFIGPVGWLLSRPKKLPFSPLKGQLGLFDPPREILKRLGLSA